MKISGKGNRVFLTVDGVRCGVSVSAGPWNRPELAGMIKVYAKTYRGFPAGAKAALDVQNNSDMLTDYFEKDTLRLFPGHPLYTQAQAAIAE